MRDLIVVGAGPVGSHFAKKMAEKNLDVMVIERSREIGKPLACSGHVSPDIKDFVSDFPSIKQNEINKAVFHLSGNSYSFYKDEVVSYVIDRVGLDKLKFKEAKEEGVNFNLGEKVVEVVEGKEKVTVKTDKESYNSKMVAGCDGASSTVRNSLGLSEPDHFYQGILCFSEEEDSSDNVDVYLDIPKFFGWRIPRSDSVEYGVGVPQGESPKKWLKNVIDKSNVTMEETKNFCAGAIPIGPPSKITSRRGFLIGDAAGQTKPFTGGGILYGMKCAEIAAENIDLNDISSLAIYEDSWRKRFKNEILLGKLIEKGYSFPTPLQIIGMKIFSGRIGVHMDHPTSLFSFQQIKSLLKK